MDTQLEGQVVVGIGWLERFSSHLVSMGRSRCTIEAYVSDVQGFAAWFEGVNGQVFSPEFITGVDLRAYRQECLEVGRVRPATWNRKRAALRVLFGWARREGFISHSFDVFEGVAEVEEVEQAPRWLEEKEYLRFMRQVEAGVVGAKTDAGRWLAVRDRAVVALMVWAGLREGEVCALEVGDVVVSERKGEVVVRSGKGGKRRRVPLNVDARRAISAWLELRGQGDVLGRLFVGRRGEALGVRGVQRRVAMIGEGARLEVSPHVLRHTFCKRTLVRNAEALGAGALVAVAELAGHARLDTTRRYVQPSREELARAVERI